MKQRIFLPGLGLLLAIAPTMAPIAAQGQPFPQILDYPSSSPNQHQERFLGSHYTPSRSASLNSSPSIDQLTSVSQLSDVQPTDWAYQALASLVEKYGCIAGYPDGTFRGNRAATRFELAAALNACLDVISDRFATKDELAILRQLMEEFATELALVQGRVNNLDGRLAHLEANQFATTTQLSGQTIFAVQMGDTTGTVFDPVTGLTSTSGDFNPTVISKVVLNLDTSFTGTDLLQIALEVGNNGFDTIGGAGIGIDGFINA